MVWATQEQAVRIANAVNELGHIALGHSLDDARRSTGDAALRESFHAAATLVLELVMREEKSNPEVVPRSGEVKAALSPFLALVQSIDWDDAEGLARLRTYARQALEAFIRAELPG
ncbi:MAG TPA: hypothetical protein VEY88_06335 [Archangium sp.]|nr:hypothetical protein [Archangium sp.]